MSQFLILITGDERAMAKATVEQQKEVMASYMKYSADLKSAGVMLGGEGLEPSASGARISWKEGHKVVTDGPFTEAKEVIAGFYMIDVKSRDEALEWAAKCPGAKLGAVEVRTVMTYPK